MFDLAISDGVARLRLVRPEARNAIPVAGWAKLESALDEAESQGGRLLILSGSGEAFCAGADLSDFDAMRSEPGAASRLRESMRHALDRLRHLSVPSIAVIEGPCFGAGVALAMACDLRIAGQGARFAITPAKLGISFPQEDVHRFVSLVGPGQASRLLFTGIQIDGREAERICLVEQYAGEMLAESVDALVAAILANSPASLAALKRGIALGEAGMAQDEEQDQRFDALLASEELTGRLAAFRGRKGR